MGHPAARESGGYGYFDASGGYHPFDTLGEAVNDGSVRIRLVEDSSMELPTPGGIEAALAGIRPHVPETPLVRSELLSRAFAADLWLKFETVTPVASFKLRGALNAMLRARERSGASRFVTSSTGNHGQGVAYAARLLGLSAEVFMPADGNPVKAAAIRAFGARLHLVGRDNNEAKEAATAHAERKGAHFVDDGESLDVMEGAGTVGLEVARAQEGLDAVYVPVGDAPLITGTGCALKSVQPRVRVVGVQSEGAPALARSFRSGEHRECEVDTLADGLATRFPARRALAGIRTFADDVLEVPDKEMLGAMHTLLESAHVLVELAGAAALAGAWRERERLEGKRVVLILSGANATISLVRRALETEPLVSLPGS